MDLKICPRCNLSKSANSEFFHRNRSNKTGYAVYCKDCAHNYDNARYRVSNPIPDPEYLGVQEPNEVLPAKVCTVCGQLKVLDQYYRNKLRADGRISQCKSCAKIRDRKNHLRVDTVTRKTQREAYKQSLREFVWNFQKEKGCVDCGINNPVVLDFDHVKGEKCFNISKMVARGFSISALQEEIDKCEVRCANCHRIVTAKRGNFYVGPDDV